MLSDIGFSLGGASRVCKRGTSSLSLSIAVPRPHCAVRLPGLNLRMLQLMASSAVVFSPHSHCAPALRERVSSSFLTLGGRTSRRCISTWRGTPPTLSICFVSLAYGPLLHTRSLSGPDHTGMVCCTCLREIRLTEFGFVQDLPREDDWEESSESDHDSDGSDEPQSDPSPGRAPGGQWASTPLRCAARSGFSPPVRSPPPERGEVSSVYDAAPTYCHRVFDPICLVDPLPGQAHCPKSAFCPLWQGLCVDPSPASWPVEKQSRIV